MFCLKCGKEISGGAKFCPHCGAVISPGASAGGSTPTKAPVYTIPDFDVVGTSPASGGKKRRGTGLIIGGAVAVVLVIAVILAAIGGLFSSPKGTVEKALAKTVAAYSEAKDKMGAPDLAQLMKDKSYTQNLSVELGSINQELTGWYDLSSLKGIGVRLNADYDQKGRKMDLDMAVFYDDDDLASIQMLVDGGKMLFASPEFTKGDAYGFNTETLGKDLDKLGVEDDDIDVKKIGFNIFDLMEKAAPSEEDTKEMEKIMADARKALLDAVEVEKTGKQNVDVNGKSTDAVLYHVVIPKDAMKDYVNALEDAMKLVDTADMLEEIFLSVGLDKAAVKDIMSQMNTTDVYGELAGQLKQAVKTIGDVELDVYVSGGYVCAVEYSKKINGTKVEIEAYLGGGANYVDDLSMKITVGSEKVTIESSGDHAGKSGVFTDETTIRADSGRITSELRWEPKASKNNFEWELRVDSTASIQMEGQLTTDKNSVDLHLDELSISAAGTRLLSLEADYYLGPCKGMQVSMPDQILAGMLGDMDRDDLEDLYYDIQENAEDWAYDMMDKIPSDLVNLLNYYYYYW